MKTSQIFKTLAAISILSPLMLSCERASNGNDSGSSKMEINFPGKKESKAGTLAATKKTCYGIEINQSSIKKTSATSCAPSFGQMIGFIAEGGTAVVELPKGSGYQFNLYAYIVDAAELCPTWNAVFNTTGNNFGRLYRVGSTTANMEKEQENISILLKPFHIRESVMALDSLKACNNPNGPDVVAKLLSNGDIRNKNDSPFISATDFSRPDLASIFKIELGQNDNDGLGYISNSGALSIAANVNVPPYVHSVTRKPDSKDFYGLLQDGSIVIIDPSSGDAKPLADESCPFYACKVPVWIQSISAGAGTDLFALDHSGQIYSQDKKGVMSPVSTKVDPNVAQVVFY